MPDVRGLTGTESNPDGKGNDHAAFEWGPAETSFHPLEDPTGKILDPCHSKGCVAQQLTGGNQGFITNFLESRKDKNGNHVTIPAEYHALPMGHYGAQHLPMYDFLARNFAVCDAWHSSVPGDTWPNRLFALAGKEGPKTLPPLLEHIEERFKHLMHQARGCADLRRRSVYAATHRGSVALVLPRPRHAPGRRRKVPALR